MMHDSSENIIRYFRELLLSSVIDTAASLIHYFSLNIYWLWEIIKSCHLKNLIEKLDIRYFIYNDLFSLFK